MKSIEAPAGDWVDELAVELPMLLRSEVLGLASHRTVLSVDPREYRSNVQVVGGIVGTHPILRSHSYLAPGFRLMCGRPSVDDFGANWVLECEVGDASISVATSDFSNDPTMAGGIEETRDLLVKT